MLSFDGLRSACLIGVCFGVLRIGGLLLSDLLSSGVWDCGGVGSYWRLVGITLWVCLVTVGLH